LPFGTCNDEDIYGIDSIQNSNYVLNHERCGRSSEKKINFIVGKDNYVQPGTMPWVCSLGSATLHNWDHQCGTVAITPKHLLTAAHCPEAYKKKGRLAIIMVRCGDHNLAKSLDDSAHTQEIPVRKAFKRGCRWRQALISYALAGRKLYLCIHFSNFNVI